MMELGHMIFGNYQGGIEIEREVFQPLFEKLVDKLPDIYDTFENEVFSYRPYYWGDDDETQSLPNFLYKPTSFELRWYKYPLRDAYVNKEISEDAFREIVEKCIESLG